MEIPEKLMRFKYPIIVAIVFSLILFSLFVLAPSFLNVLLYFWPLYLSTALFLVAVVIFGRTSPPVTESSGEELIDYVAGTPEQAHEINYKTVARGQHEETEENYKAVGGQPEEAEENDKTE